MNGIDGHIRSYKNFNMVKELDIAGTFIYDAMSTLNKMKDLQNETDIFYFLYHASVGFERLQKILIVLLGKVSSQNYEDFEKTLITHSHQELNMRIVSATNLEFNSRENSFLQLLGNFYKSCRYDRFNTSGSLSKEKEVLEIFLEQTLKQQRETCPFIGSFIDLNPQIKKQIGKIMKSIAQKYYRHIVESARKQFLFTYETKAYSKAQSVFLSDEKSFYNIVVNEEIAHKELLIYLMNSSDREDVRGYMKEIAPLEFDEALIQGYLHKIFNHEHLQELVDEVETLYEEVENKSERIDMLLPIGKPNCYFDGYREYREENL